MAESTLSPVAGIFADTNTHGVIIADGYGISVSVAAGHLIISDGIGRTRRERRVPRMPRTVERLVISGSTGVFTIEAQRWLADAGIPWIHIDHENRILAMSGPQRTDARLTRAQALAPGSETGLDITRALLTAKLAGQSGICRDILRVPGAAHNIDDLASELERCPELDDCRSVEGAAAVAYWQAWADRVTVPFSPHDMMKVPAHWLSFTGRDSEIGPAHRHATGPANALLNYVYKVAETECVHACHAVGLNPELGILHADKPGRDSFALDLIEVVRPLCERLILGMLDTGLGVPRDNHGKPAYLDRRWFTETRDGQCRIVAPLTHRLAGFAAEIGATVRPHAEHAARILANASPGIVRVPKAKARKTAAAPPKTSGKTARLRDGVNLSDVIPAPLWARVIGYLPETPAGPYGHRKTGRQRDTSLDREALAVNVCTELLGIPYGTLRASVSPQTARARRMEWQWSKTAGSVTVWDHITGEVQGFGHLAALTV